MATSKDNRQMFDTINGWMSTIGPDGRYNRDRIFSSLGIKPMASTGDYGKGFTLTDQQRKQVQAVMERELGMKFPKGIEIDKAGSMNENEGLGKQLAKWGPIAGQVGLGILTGGMSLPAQLAINAGAGAGIGGARGGVKGALTGAGMGAASAYGGHLLKGLGGASNTAGAAGTGRSALDASALAGFNPDVATSTMPLGAALSSGARSALDSSALQGWAPGTAAAAQYAPIDLAGSLGTPGAVGLMGSTPTVAGRSALDSSALAGYTPGAAGAGAGRSALDAGALAGYTPGRSALNSSALAGYTPGAGTAVTTATNAARGGIANTGIGAVDLAILGGSTLANLFGAKMASNAAKDAAKIQAESADKALAQQERFWNQSQQNLQPWLRAGTGAVTSLANLMGVPMMAPDRVAPMTTTQAAPTTTQAPPQQGGGSLGQMLGRPPQTTNLIPNNPYVAMRGPDGSVRQVPGAQAAQWEARGARRM